MYQKLFLPLNLTKNQVHCFNAKSVNLVAECQKINDLITTNQGLDLILLGIGSNGHLAMNEPGTDFGINCHVSKLAQSTIDTGQKYFKKETTLSLGITLGLGQIAASKNIILMANGLKKAKIIFQTINSKPNPELPSSILINNKKAILMIDNEAASLIS
jgi:galactosamine-6-phosphate isomerase